MITSASNKTAKLVKSLSLKKNRDSSGLFLVEGKRFVSMIPSRVKIEFYVLSEEFDSSRSDLRSDVETLVVSNGVFKSLCDTQAPQGVIAVCQKMDFSLNQILTRSDCGLYIILEGVKDPGNIGSIIRSADALGVNAILTTENTVDIYNPKVLRSTMGSIFNVSIASSKMVTIANELRSRGITILGASLNAEKFCYDEEYSKTAVIIGSEAFGLSDDAVKSSERLINIPMEGKAESLNAAAAASIIMYEALRQRMRMQKNVCKEK